METNRTAFTILVRGLPGSGKTSFCNDLLDNGHFTEDDITHYNADNIRSASLDFNFDAEARIRQAKRMSAFANTCSTQFALLDFVCPTKETIDIVNPDVIIYCDTIDESRYSDTNLVFQEEYEVADVIVGEFRILSARAAGIKPEDLYSYKQMRDNNE
jgi:adenylylsulfate kinase